MHDPRPLSERFDLTYVRRRQLSDRWTRPLSLAAVILVVAVAGAVMMQGDFRAFSSGPLTQAHAMFADDCGKCHAPDPDRSGYWLPARDELCLNCHVAPLHNPHQSMFVGLARPVGTEQVVMSSNCSTCHVEHLGAEADLSAVSDATCVRCHADLERDGWSGDRAESPPGSALQSLFARNGGRP
jgi:predicted CXXCH cytochrome family protein